MSEKNIFDKIREDVKAGQKPEPDINERFGKPFGKPANESAFDKIRREADERRAARDAEKQKLDEIFNRMKNDNLII